MDNKIKIAIAFTLVFLLSLPLAFVFNVEREQIGGNINNVETFFETGIYSFMLVPVGGWIVVGILFLLITALCAGVLGWLLGRIIEKFSIRWKYIPIILPALFLALLFSTDRYVRAQNNNIFYRNLVEAECQFIKKSYLRNHCFKVVHEISNLAQCEGMYDRGREEYCITRLAAEKKDPQLCQQLGLNDQEECFTRVAKAMEDPAVCDYIIPASLDIWDALGNQSLDTEGKVQKQRREICYSAVAQLKEDATICLTITGYEQQLPLEDRMGVTKRCQDVIHLPVCDTEQAVGSLSCRMPIDNPSPIWKFIDVI